MSRAGPAGPRLRKSPVLQAFFSSDGPYVAQLIVTFLIILALMIGALFLYRWLFGRSLSLVPGTASRGRQPRLGIVDIYELDRHRQLILLRRDNVEHLLLVGGPNDVVIERHIQRGAGARYTAEGGRDPEPAPPDALDGPGAERFLDSPAPPTFAMPEVVPPDLPGAEPVHPERTPPLDPGLFEPEEPSTPASARPASAMSRLIRRTPPPLANLRPDPAERPRPEAAAQAAASVPASDPVPEAPPVIAGRGPRPVDPSVLSDMARQLQVALKRPSSAVTPPPTLPAAAEPPVPAPARPPEPAPKPLDPLAAAMAAAHADPLEAPPAAPPPPQSPPTFVPAPPAPAPKPAPDPAEAKSVEAKSVDAKPVEAKPADIAPAEARAPEPKTPEPVSAEPPLPEPRPEPARREAPPPEPPKPDLAKPEPSKPEPAPAETGAQNPFSVEEIEAEFARLLGRPLDTKR